MFQSVLVSCRPGFEKECAAELSVRVAQLQLAGYPQTEQESGYCLFRFHEPLRMALVDQFAWSTLVFARSIVFMPSQGLDVPVDDRITPIMEQVNDWGKKARFDFLLV